MTRHRKRALLLTVLVGVVGTIVWMVAWAVASPPPTAAFASAREAISGARAVEAERYSPASFQAGEAAWTRALDTWRSENARFFLARDYTEAEAAAHLASRLADIAHREAESRRDSLRWIAESGRDAVREQLELLRGQLKRLPAKASWQQAAARTHTLLAESEGAYERSDYLTAAEKAREAFATLSSVDVGVRGSLDTYLEDLPLWQEWNEETVRWSAENRARAIVVDKMALRLHLYDGGRLVRSYPIELGPRWMGPKRSEGDHATPEGKYFVRRKRGPGETIYYRALEINYPNDQDRARFDRARRDGTLPRNARIGGLIEIHGEGGIGANWTRGCIALDNGDMKSLFDQAAVSTPVTIVGALDVPEFLNGTPIHTVSAGKNGMGKDIPGSRHE